MLYKIQSLTSKDITCASSEKCRAMVINRKVYYQPVKDSLRSNVRLACN